MKVKYSSQICAFGGYNFVINEYDQLEIGTFLNDHLPVLGSNSKYSWKDLFYSFSGIYYCGGQYIEDVGTVLSRHFSNNPLFQLSSSDTLLRRLKLLASETQTCRTKRGVVEHQFNVNNDLADVLIKLAKLQGCFTNGKIALDYDNTILFTEKQDCKMTYKRNYGYQPGVCFLNENQVIYLENRNGNSDAKSFQVDTLTRMFDLLEQNGINKIDTFRADAASYQFDVFQLLSDKVEHLYIGARNSYVEGYYPLIKDWTATKDSFGDDILVGQITYCPFERSYQQGEEKKQYRLLVKKKRKPNGQINLFTQDDYEYHSIVTNDFDIDVIDGFQLYNRRGAVEKQFDILKNDFGWDQLPFSKLAHNTVFLFFSAICRNLYNDIIDALANSFKTIHKSFRMKRLIFNLITIPAKWIKSARQWCLVLYNKPLPHT
jgi:hypothetical protein